MAQNASARFFKMMTADNGPEFENLSQFESLGTKMYSTYFLAALSLASMV